MANFAKYTSSNRSSARHVRVYGGTIALLLALCPIAPAPTYADDPPREAERDAIRRMNEQILELQAKVKELEARLNDFQGGATQGAIESSAPPSAPREVTPPPTSASAAQESQEANSEPSVRLRVFGD
jgi:hypothetical protein